LGEISIDRSLE